MQVKRWQLKPETVAKLFLTTIATEGGHPMHEDRLRYLFNRQIEAALPGLSVASLRHVTEAISLQAVEVAFSNSEQQREMGLAMIALSAHSEATSDERYAGDQHQIGGISAYHVDK